MSYYIRLLFKTTVRTLYSGCQKYQHKWILCSKYFKKFYLWFFHLFKLKMHSPRFNYFLSYKRDIRKYEIELKSNVFLLFKIHRSIVWKNYLVLIGGIQHEVMVTNSKSIYVGTLIFLINFHYCIFLKIRHSQIILLTQAKMI